VAVQSFWGLKMFLGWGHLLLCGSAASGVHANGQRCSHSSSAKGPPGRGSGVYAAGSVEAVRGDEVCLCWCGKQAVT
jgi:hypothetical protein